MLKYAKNAFSLAILCILYYDGTIHNENYFIYINLQRGECRTHITVLTIMKHIRILKPIFSVILLTLLLFAPYHVSQAGNDDPGAGRLSGDNISEDFYDEPPVLRPYGISRYGGFVSKSPYTGLNYTHQDVFTGRTILHGIDVSEWQGEIDWTKVKAAGIDYAFIRVGYRGYGKAGTLSAATKDTYFDTNMKNAIAAGMKVGVYIFSQAITVKEAQEEADYILKYINGYNITMPLIMDYEYASDASDGGRLKTAKLSKTAATNICMAFCERIAASGYTPMVYANKSMLTDQMNAQTITNAGYRVWLANYTTQTTYTGKYDFWQYSSTGKVNGINGNVDMNFYYVQAGDNFLPNTNSIASAVVSAIPDQTYTGKSITPAVTVTHNGVALVPNIDYSVSYSSNKSIGTATVKIIGKNNYRNTKTVTFKILPKTMSTVKAKKRSTTYITLSWSKDSNVTGYQIYRSDSLNGTYKKIKTITKKTTTSYKNTKLGKGKCYYYKIRSYKKVGSSTYYGAFSSVKAIYTKMGYTRNAIAKTGTILYDTASTDGQQILTPAANTVMSVAYSTKDANGKTWYYVSCKSGNKTYKGFVPSGKVTITKLGKVTKASKVNVRKSYTTKSKKLTTLKRNKQVNIITTKTKKGVRWYKVTFKKNGKQYTGWISAPYIKIL